MNWDDVSRSAKDRVLDALISRHERASASATYNADRAADHQGSPIQARYLKAANDAREMESAFQAAIDYLDTSAPVKKETTE